jgi:hypothetical protein
VLRRIHHTGLESIAELSHLHNYNLRIQIVLFAVNINYAANRRELPALRAVKKASWRVFTTIVVAFAIVLFSSKSQPKQIVSRADQTGQLAFNPTSGGSGANGRIWPAGVVTLSKRRLEAGLLCEKLHAVATTSRHVVIAAARSARCD